MTQAALEVTQGEKSLVELARISIKGEGRDPFLEAKSLESRLPSGLGYRTPKEVMEEVLGQGTQDVTREAG